MSNRDEERARRIRSFIRRSERALVERFAILGRHDLMGGATFLVAASGMIGLGTLYARELIPAWVCVLGCAVLARSSTRSSMT